MFSLLGLVVALGVIGGGIFGYVNWSNRYRWPRQPVPSLQDLPPLDKTQWPRPPLAWSNTTVAVEVATPDGLKITNITYYINSVGMKLVRIEPGTFWEGLTKAQSLRMHGEHKYGHQVTLTKPYYIAAYETTIELFEQYDPTFVKRRVWYERGKGFEDHPVIGVKWRECQQFCRWLSTKEGRLYRLPTEAEWEYACKAGTTTILYWGDNAWDRRKANVGGIREAQESYGEDGYMYTSPVGVYPPNPWGLYDMIGNTWEWVNDWFDWFPSEPQTDPTGPPTGHMRVDKGAGWDTRTRHLKSCARDGNNPADLFEDRGFRVLCELAQP
ncbi:MAG TPA: formylglycine-generating enzyme family protein [Verrucomicrobiae bacterium]|nr:formylglycine-generating enzyme family protein [Verrucomicrobiae bacterium]